MNTALFPASPKALQILFDQAIQHHQAGRFAEAEQQYKHILNSTPQHSDALHLLGVIALQKREYENAVAWIKKAIAIKEDVSFYHYNLGNALKESGLHDEAIAHYKRAIALKPDYAEAYNNLGVLLKDQGKLDEAVAQYRRILAIKPDTIEALNNLGNILKNQGKLDEAMDCYQRALSFNPGHLTTLNNSGLALHEQGHYAEAFKYYERAIALFPAFAEAHFNQSMLHLLQGDYATGWKGYEWRWRTNHHKPFPSPMPLWDGGDLKNKTILLHCEQGFGDSLQFIRYAALVKERGGYVILSCPKPLMRLFKNVSGVDAIIPEDIELPPHDYYASLMSLPLLFNTLLETIPSAVPYITPSSELVAEWATRVQPYKKQLNIGLVWAGNPRLDQPNAYAIDRRRSMSLQQFAPLATIPDVCFFSLQKGDKAAQLSNVPHGMAMIDLMESANDFADTAALIANLDLVIGVDTSVIHLSGAIGKPTWVLSRFDGCWRWLLERDDSPWYPNTRLFRQPKAGDWESVIANVHDAVQTMR